MKKLFLVLFILCILNIKGAEELEKCVVCKDGKAPKIGAKRRHASCLVPLVDYYGCCCKENLICLGCAKSWAERSGKCPMCRSSYKDIMYYLDRDPLKVLDYNPKVLSKFREPYTRFTILMSAIDRNDRQLLNGLLEKIPDVDLSETDPYGRTVWHYAGIRNPEILQLLLDKTHDRSNISTVDFYNYTPLGLTLSMHASGNAKTLIQNGAILRPGESYERLNDCYKGYWRSFNVLLDNGYMYPYSSQLNKSFELAIIKRVNPDILQKIKDKGGKLVYHDNGETIVHDLLTKHKWACLANLAKVINISEFKTLSGTTLTQYMQEKNISIPSRKKRNLGLLRSGLHLQEPSLADSSK